MAVVTVMENQQVLDITSLNQCMDQLRTRLAQQLLRFADDVNWMQRSSPAKAELEPLRRDASQIWGQVIRRNKMG